MPQNNNGMGGMSGTTQYGVYPGGIDKRIF